MGNYEICLVLALDGVVNVKPVVEAHLEIPGGVVVFAVFSCVAQELDLVGRVLLDSLADGARQSENSRGHDR